jgi:calmodulin
MDSISEEELRENFDHFDADGDGKLELSEFIHLLDALDALDTEEQAKIGFREIDSDGSGRVDFEEFSEWFKAN